MRKFLAKNLVVLIVIVIILAVGGAFWYVEANRAPSFTGTAVTQGNVIESLNEPATVVAENNANLSFQASGEIAVVDVKEGEVVSAGTPIASLTNASLQAALQQAQAGLAAAQANLDQSESGTRPEQLAIDQTAVTNAQASLSAADLNAYTAADDAIHNQADNMFSLPRSNNPTFLVPVSNSQEINNIQSSRVIIEGLLTTWYNALSASSTNATSSLPTIAISSLDQIQSFLDSIALAVNDASTNASLSPSTLAGYKANVITSRAEIGGAITALTNAQSALQTAQSNLALAQAGSTSQQIEAQTAAVAQAQAQVASAQVALNNTTLVAPFSGTVQNLTAQVGQVVSAGSPVLSLVNNSGLKIEAYVSEADVAKIKVGDTANVTLDAFGNNAPFPATVGIIDNAETQVNGTPAYLVTLYFTNPESQVKDGMTGNAQIILAEHDNVVEVPTNLIVTQGNNNYVLVQKGATTQQEQVQVGITGDNGMTEIVSGVQVGDQLVNF
jgi:RND family efflux transporter MFP subunit